MKKRVGMTTDPERRKQFWQNLYPSLKNWKIIRENLNYQEAQDLERHYEILGYERGAGGGYVADYTWSVYTFEY